MVRRTIVGAMMTFDLPTLVVLGWVLEPDGDDGCDETQCSTEVL